MRRTLLTIGTFLVSGACASVRASAPVGPRNPEPAAPPITAPPILVAAPTTRDLLQAYVDSVRAAPMWRNARWGMLLVHAERGDTLLALDADRLFMPASNQKLLTGAIAVERLGPDYRWRTPVVLQGIQRGARFTGDVQVAGNGDPSVSDALQGDRADHAFLPIIAALRARGITRITGRVRAVGDAFPGETTGYGWAYDDFDEEYSAPVDELTFNEGELTLRIRAGAKAGAPVTVERAPTRGYPPLRIDATTRDTGTVDAGGPRPLPIRAAYDSVGETLVISGTLARGDSLITTVAYRHPNDAYVTALRAALLDSGIVVAGRPLARRDTAQRRPDTLAVLESASFADVLRRMQKPSQNQIAELLFRTSGLVTSGVGRADSARAVGARTLAQWGVTAADAAYRDGSGLSRHDYVTPRALVKVLDAMRRSPHYAMYRDALPIAGVDGTIRNRMKGTPAQGNARGKTGTVDKARSLSGYVTTADGQLVLFSLLCNNFTVPTREVERVQDFIVATLAGQSLGVKPVNAPAR
jgi:D-alanyl-D-alanine carboxypeptidase/D-alanyl-D-alanine-endopeptidase (penicillin-binding protein 4)